MRRSVQATLVVLVVVLLPVFWLFRAPTALPAHFSLADCRHLKLANTATGRPIVGVEDMALLPDGDTLILSAIDRLALRWNPASAPDGGLYEVSLARLATGARWAQPILDPASVPGGLFPGGIAVSDDGKRLAVINRARDGEVSILGGDLAPGVFTVRDVRRDRAFCRAKDLAFSGAGPMAVRVTLDRAACGLSWADLRPGSTTGRVISVDLAGTAPPKVEMRGLAFASGIAGLWVAETRAWRLRHRLDRPLPLPGGPDNLTWSPDGGLIAALDPSLPRIVAYRLGYRDNAPSRIVRVGENRRVEVLFDDPEGQRFSGASVAVLAGGVLVAGSAIDAGLLLCRKGGG